MLYDIYRLYFPKAKSWFRLSATERAIWLELEEAIFEDFALCDNCEKVDPDTFCEYCDFSD